MLKYLGDVSADYSRIDNISFKGMSFGASNVYAFVGLGTPDYVKDACHRQADASPTPTTWSASAWKAWTSA